MEIHQLKTFVAVAREGSITRASERLGLSQPAVSAHIKAIEDVLGIALFERTAKGMSLTPDGERLLVKAEQTLGAHDDLIAEAKRIKGSLTGRLRLATASNSSSEALGRLMTALAERHPEVDVALQHGTSLEVLNGLRNGSVDAGFYNEPGEPDAGLSTVEVARFATWLAAPPGLEIAATKERLDWAALAELSWIFPTASACCGQAAENLFKAHAIRPKKIISVDREIVTRGLVAGGVGVGLLHADTANDAAAKGEVTLLCEAPGLTRVLFAHLASRAADPMMSAANAILRGDPLA